MVVLTILICYSILEIPYEMSNPILYGMIICVTSFIVCCLAMLAISKKKMKLHFLVPLCISFLYPLLNIFLYTEGAIADLALFLFLPAFIVANFFFTRERLKLIVCNLHTVVAVSVGTKFSTTLYFNHVSHDYETPAVGTLMLFLCVACVLGLSVVSLIILQAGTIQNKNKAYK